MQQTFGRCQEGGRNPLNERAWRLTAVTHYRVYLLIAPDRIKSEKRIGLVNDAAAIQHADELFAAQRCYGIEVWEGLRLVYKKIAD